MLRIELGEKVGRCQEHFLKHEKTCGHILYLGGEKFENISLTAAAGKLTFEIVSSNRSQKMSFL